mmetsp:Transcript_29885/g.45691  ORF Transcript_29885/g.45691 Transcript_29885/m.45691 type:complete len:86 (+) Transcript_29885:285-542(+)
MVQWSCSSFSLYGFQYMLKGLKGNIFYNTMSICVSNVISQLVGNILLKRFKTKKTIVMGYILGIFAVGVLITSRTVLDEEQTVIV